MGKEIHQKIEPKEDNKVTPLCHHARELKHCIYGVVRQKRRGSKYFDKAYDWLEHEVGFYPLFLTVGETIDDITMTGYQNQWRRLLAEGKNYRKYRQTGEIENQVLFSFSDIPSGAFRDYMNWHMVLNSEYNNYQIADRARKMVFRPSWGKSDWLRYARRNPHSVQLVVPELDLRKTTRIWVRNIQTQLNLESVGFRNIEVRRVPVSSY